MTTIDIRTRSIGPLGHLATKTSRSLIQGRRGPMRGDNGQVVIVRDAIVQ